MRAVITRLRRLEGSLAPKVDPVSQRKAEILQERQRRRLEASGQTYEPLDWGSLSLPPGRCLSSAETARFACQLRLKRDRERATQSQARAVQGAED
jgi:hypothetical protein